MKKLYITIFALMVGLVSTYGNAFDCSCFFKCMDDEVIVIDSTQQDRPDAAPDVAPDAAPVAVPIAQAMPAPRLKLTSAQQQRIIKPSHGAPIELAPIDEEASVSQVIPVAFQKRNPIAKPKQKDTRRILLDAIKHGEIAKAHQLLDSKTLTERQLTIRNSQGKTPFLYAIQHEYWDIAQKLIELRVETPLLDDIKLVISPAENPEKYKRCLLKFIELCTPVTRR